MLTIKNNRAILYTRCDDKNERRIQLMTSENSLKKFSKDSLFKNIELNRLQFKLPEGVFQAVKAFSEADDTDSNITNFFLDFINYRIEELEKEGKSINVLGEDLENDFKKRFLKYMTISKENDPEVMYDLRYRMYMNLMTLLGTLINKNENKLSEEYVKEFMNQTKEELRKLLEILYEDDYDITGVEMRKLINLFLFNKVRLYRNLDEILQNDKIKRR